MDPLALNSAGPLISGAVAATRAVPRGLIGVIARVVVTFLNTHVTTTPDSYVVIATPEIR
jgi:hypothetical protein